MIRVLLVDKVRLVREVIGAVLEGEPDIQLVDLAINEEDALRATQNPPAISSWSAHPCRKTGRFH